MTTSRRTFLGLVGGGALAAGLAACGSSGPKSTSGSTTGGAAAGSGTTTYWFLTGQPQQAIREAQVKRFNGANSGSTIKTTEFQNDAFKQKIKTAIGAATVGSKIYAMPVETVTPIVLFYDKR